MSDIFSIFNPDWWVDENNNALQIADAVLYLLLAIPVLYLFVCALFSLGKYKNPYPLAKTQYRFLVLFTVLRNGKEVINSINHFLDTVKSTTLQLQQPSYLKKTLSPCYKCQ